MYSGKVYREQGGNKIVVASGGEIEVRSGGVLDIQAGATITPVLGVAAGYKLARGLAVGTTNLTAATGLATIAGYAVSPVGSTATQANTGRVVTAKPQATTATTLAIKRYKASGASTATLIASTSVGTVSWIAVGT